MTMEIIPVRNDRLSDKVVEQLISMMKDGSLKAGDKLPNETVLAEQFGISRGILREALTQLQSQGYIRRRPKDGTFIEDDIQTKLMNASVNEVIKQATYRDLLDFREVIELKMVECVIERATDDEIDELMESVSGVAGNDEMQRSMDHYFHYRLAQASRNIFFMNFIDTYYDLISEIAVMSGSSATRRTEIAEEHRAIANAIARRDVAAAREAVLKHMRMVQTKINKIKE